MAAVAPTVPEDPRDHAANLAPEAAPVKRVPKAPEATKEKTVAMVLLEKKDPKVTKEILENAAASVPQDPWAPRESPATMVKTQLSQVLRVLRATRAPLARTVPWESPVPSAPRVNGEMLAIRDLEERKVLLEAKASLAGEVRMAKIRKIRLLRSLVSPTIPLILLLLVRAHLKELLA